METKYSKIETKCNRLILLLTLCLSFISCENSAFMVVDLDVKFISNISKTPTFSWQVESKENKFEQSACELILVNKDGVTVWDSGKLSDANQRQLNYSGAPLANGKHYEAKVKVWSTEGKESKWSDPIRFFTPIDYPEDWQAEWITYNYSPHDALPVFKKLINIPHKENIISARLFIAAPGFYEAFLNGEKIGKNVLDPGQTNYEDYTYYSVYNLNTTKLKDTSVLGVMLGNGWYNQNMVWGKGMIYGQPCFIAQLQIQYSDGTTEYIGTDKSWFWKGGPILFSNIYAGETYDANYLPIDWMDTERTDSTWKASELALKHPTELFEQFAEPIKKMDSLEVKRVIDKGKGRIILDFGQNFAGWVKIKVKGEKGQKIVIRCVEELDENGEIDPRTTGIRATKVIQTQSYICKGESIEIWEPKFTYFGFRYAEVQGLSEPLADDVVKGIVVYSSLAKTGRFSCSEENINILHELADWTLKSNIHGIPTDCPHREKCGWTGDAHALGQALMYNYDAQQFMSKYMLDMRSSARRTDKELYFGRNFQERSIINKPKGIPTMIVPGRRTSGTASPDWGTAMVQIPWYLYLYYGDMNLLSNFYPDMKVWVDYIHAKNKDGLILHGLGDWCPPGGNKNIECPVPISSTAYHILDLNIMAKVANILGYENDVEYYATLHKNTMASFNRNFLDKENFTYGSQTADVMALEIGIVPEDARRKVAEAVVKSIHEKNNGFINTGIFGLSRFFKALSENGFEDEVYRLLSKKGENSFAFMWEQYDATTLWEVLPLSLLDDDELFFRSHNHPMQAGYDAWFYSGIGGIIPTASEPGFKRITFKPYLTQHLSHADVAYKSRFGLVRSSWKNEKNSFSWEVEIPVNAKGEIYLPNYGNEVSVSVNGNDVEIQDCSNSFTLLGEYDSGVYHFKMTRL